MRRTLILAAAILWSLSAMATPAKAHGVVAIVDRRVLTINELKEESRKEVRAYMRKNGDVLKPSYLKKGVEKIMEARLEVMIEEKVLELHVEKVPQNGRKDWEKNFKAKPRDEQRRFIEKLKKETPIKRLYLGKKKP